MTGTGPELVKEIDIFNLVIDEDILTVDLPIKCQSKILISVHHNFKYYLR